MKSIISFRDNSYVRVLMYVVPLVGTVELLYRIIPAKWTGLYSRSDLSFIGTLPVVVIVSLICQNASQESGLNNSLRHNYRDLFSGLMLGLGAVGMERAMSLALGWIRNPQLGWIVWDGHVLASQLFATCSSHIASVVFEEALYRGYPLTVFALRFGPIPASLVSSIVFAWLHRFDAVGTIYFLQLGFILTLHRLMGGWWWCVGLHLGWNIGLTAISSTSTPSLIPVTLVVDEPWVTDPESGKGGYSSLITGGVMLCATLVWAVYQYRRSRK